MRESASITKKAEILDAAVRLFVERGYAHTSVMDIAQAVGLTKGGIYHYIDKKEDLLVEIYNLVVDNFTNKIMKAVTGEKDSIKRIKIVIDEHALSMNEYGDHLKIFFSELSEIDENTLSAMKQKGDDIRKVMRNIFESGIRKRVFRKDLNPDLAVLFILGILNWFYQWYKPRHQGAIEEIAKEVENFVLFGIVSDKER